jgi:ecotin
MGGGIGRISRTGDSNRHFFGGRLEEKTVKGWGYPDHILEKIGPMAAPLIGVPGAAKPVETFVKIGGEPCLVRYNSKLPVVVYVPEGREGATGSGARRKRPVRFPRDRAAQGV